VLLSIPAIAGAGALAGLDLFLDCNSTLTERAFWAAGISFLAALVAIWAMIGWLKHASFAVFVLFRLVLGCFLLFLLMAGYLVT
jgi:undecaprenyl-diphosphatase